MSKVKIEKKPDTDLELADTAIPDPEPEEIVLVSESEESGIEDLPPEVLDEGTDIEEPVAVAATEKVGSPTRLVELVGAQRYVISGKVFQKGYTYTVRTPVAKYLLQQTTRHDLPMFRTVHPDDAEQVLKPPARALDDSKMRGPRARKPQAALEID